MKILSLLALLSTFLGSSVWASLSVTEAKALMNSVAERVQPLMDEQGLSIELTIEKADKPGAYSKWLEKRKVGRILISESLLEREGLNSLGFMMIVCHEFGHFLGGEP